jgi:hypothetical protein
MPESDTIICFAEIANTGSRKWRYSGGHAEDAGVPFENLHNYLHFRVIDYEVPAAVVILDLDVPLLQRMEPIFWERRRHVISEDGYRSYISVEREDAQGGVVIEPGYRESTIRLFERGWRDSVSI